MTYIYWLEVVWKDRRGNDGVSGNEVWFDDVPSGYRVHAPWKHDYNSYGSPYEAFENDFNYKKSLDLLKVIRTKSCILFPSVV